MSDKENLRAELARITLEYTNMILAKGDNIVSHRKREKIDLVRKALETITESEKAENEKAVLKDNKQDGCVAAILAALIIFIAMSLFSIN
tara:strand:+ start:392 stop:661 length:270 start_codon:yes stop_codon:yes gene_type:complete